MLRGKFIGNCEVGGGVMEAVGVGVVVDVPVIEMYAGIVDARTFSNALSVVATESTWVVVSTETIVGDDVLGAIALKVNVPTFVMELIAFVVSDPIETVTKTLPLLIIGPSIVFGNASMLGVNIEEVVACRRAGL